MKMMLSKDKKILFANFLPKNANYYRRSLTNYSNFAEKSCKVYEYIQNRRYTTACACDERLLEARPGAA